MTHLLRWPVITAAMLCVFVSAGFGGREHKQNTLRATLSGFNEVPPINTNGEAKFKMKIEGNQIIYTLTYSGLTSNITQSHVHFGQKGVNGGIFFFLCSNLGNGPAGTPTCPATGGTVTGTITAASIVPVAAQNVASGDFASALNIIRTGEGYANLHTMNFPAGEIRGQVKATDDDD